MTVVAFADDCVGDGVENSRARGASPLVEVSRILFEDCRENDAPEQRAARKVGVRSAVSLAVALCALTISGELVDRLLDSRGGANQDECYRIDGVSKGKLEFLPRIERRGVLDIADIEIGNDAEDALLLFGFDLALRDYGGRLDYDRGVDGSEKQGDRRNDIVLAGSEDAGKGPIGKRRRANGDFERAGNHVVEGIVAAVIGGSLLAGGLAGSRQRDFSTGDGIPFLAEDRASDGSRQLLILLSGLNRSRILRLLGSLSGSAWGKPRRSREDGGKGRESERAADWGDPFRSICQNWVLFASAPAPGSQQ